MKRHLFERLALAALFTALATTIAAKTNHDDDHRLKTMEATVAKLVARCANQEAQIAKLQDDLAAASTTISQLQTSLATVQANPVLAMGPYVSVRTDTINLVKGPHIIFEGVNVHVRSGAGEQWHGEYDGDSSGHPNGLGNLIVGYNELSVSDAPTVRGGSHCLVVGPGHSYTCNWGLVAGADNSIKALLACVSGGQHSVAGAPASSVSGGCGNVIEGTAWHASTSGGGFNLITGDYAWAASISGGVSNKANGSGGSISGGWENTVGGGWAASICGGSQNNSAGSCSTISGGWQNNALDKFCASVSGGQANTAAGDFSSVTGGFNNLASNGCTSVTGGQGNVASGSFSTVGGGENRSATADNSWVAGGLVQDY